MTVNELIAELSALSPEERELPVLLSSHTYDGEHEWDPEVSTEVDSVDVRSILWPRSGFEGQTVVRALLLA
jgi:hypothetical protein